MRSKHIEGEEVTCEICGKVLKRSSIEYHMQAIHEGFVKKKKKGPYIARPLKKCGGCNQMFSPKQIYVHWKTCFDPNNITPTTRKRKMTTLIPVANFACEDCDFTSTSESGLRDHVVIHATWPCALCKAAFFNRRRYSEHLTKIHKRQITPELCIGACINRELPAGLTRKDAKNYQQWGRAGRNRTPIYDENGELYTRYSPHLECVTGDIVCKFCDESFSVIRRIILHVETIHHDRVPYKCSDCGLAFINEHCYGKHVRRFHGIDYRMVNEPEGYIDSALEYCNVLGVLKFERNKSGVYARYQRSYEKVKVARKAKRGLPVQD